MAISTPAQFVGIDEYLTNPEYEHCEWVKGEVVPLNVGTNKHSRIQINCGYKLREYCLNRPGWVAAELHCRLRVGLERRCRLPDVAFLLNEPGAGELYWEGAPDLAVEIQSPDDPVSFLIDKAREYFANGCKLVWIVLPEEQSVLVLTPDAAPTFRSNYLRRIDRIERAIEALIDSHERLAVSEAVTDCPGHSRTAASPNRQPASGRRDPPIHQETSRPAASAADYGVSRR